MECMVQREPQAGRSARAKPELPTGNRILRLTSVAVSGKIHSSQSHERETMSYNFEKTIGGQLIAKLREELCEVIEVDNSMLPESYRVALGSRTLAEIDREYNRRQAEKVESIHAEKKATKAELIEVYAAKVERGEALFEENEGEDN